MVNVETFEQTELGAEGCVEKDSEALALIDRLGLDGQRELLNPDTSMRCPYRVMNAVELRVYQALYPEHTAIERYRNGMIPLRVLQIAAHAQPFYLRIEVWTERTAQTDPVLVGISRPAGTWVDQVFILARWGEALKPFADLRKQAIELTCERLRLVALKARTVAESILAAPQAVAMDSIDNGVEPVFGS